MSRFRPFKKKVTFGFRAERQSLLRNRPRVNLRWAGGDGPAALCGAFGGFAPEAVRALICGSQEKTPPIHFLLLAQ